MTDFNKEDRLWEEYLEYIKDNELSKYERRLLRKWVRDGHSVYETVESMYAPGPAFPPMDFIDAYRFDRSLRIDMKGMTASEKEAYLKDFFGYTEATEYVYEIPDENPLPEW